jgi:hypothetical protein
MFLEVPVGKKMSLVKDLLELQIGIGKRDLSRRREVIIKKLIVSPCREFKNSSQILSRGSNIFTFMHAGRLFRQQSLQQNKGNIYFQNYGHVFTFTHFAEVVCSSAYPSRTLKAKKLPTLQKLFTFPCDFKCEDLDIWSPDSAVSTESLLLHEGINISKAKILHLK